MKAKKLKKMFESVDDMTEIMYDDEERGLVDFMLLVSDSDVSINKL